MKGKLPVSKAKTAYGLLSEIAALAIAEPKRIAMTLWLQKETGPQHRSLPEGYPACGTVGCVGGWTIALKPTAARKINGGLFGPDREDSGQRAGRRLGLTEEQADELFLPSDICNSSNQQTPAHARAVVAHIRRFQKKYRTQLLAKKV